MPSAEKLSSEALKVEGAPSNEPKSSENAQKEVEQNNGEKSISPIQQVLQIINNKVRNLEKRKNKLDGYIKEEEEGKELSSEQKKAVQKYEEVVSQLAISKEFCKQFQTIASLASKEAKREARKATFLRQMQETTKVREVLIIQDLLRQLKNDAIRSDFLNAQNGACLVDAAEMNVLEYFSKHTTPVHPSFSNEPSFSTSAKASADHFSFVVDGRTRQFLDTGFTYEKIKELFQRIQSCGYFEKDIEIVEEPERPTESASPPTDCDLDSGKEEKSTESASILPPNGGGPGISSPSKIPPVAGIPAAMIPTPAAPAAAVVAPTGAPQVLMPSAPLPTQMPNPTQLFNGNVSGIMPVMQNVQMKTTVTAVENAFFNQMKYSQGPMTAMQPNRYVEDFASANISFLQDSLVDQNSTGSQQQQQQQLQQPKPPQAVQQKMAPPNANNLVSQPKHSPIQVHPQVQQQHQQQGISTQTFTNQNFHPQQQQQAPQQPHHFPPGLKLQNAQASNIPVNIPPTSNTVQYQPQPPQAQQQMPTSQKMPNLPEHHHHQLQQQVAPVHHHQPPPPQQPQPQHVEQKSNHNIGAIDGACDKNETANDRKMHGIEKEKSRGNEWNQPNNQPPQIDTWNNDASTGGGNSAPTSGGGGNSYSRFNRNANRGSGGGGSGGGSKYNNYRNSQQPRNNYNNSGSENGNGDLNAGGSGGSATFFRNNEPHGRYSGGNSNNNNGGGGNGRYNKPREGNYRAGSGRFPSSLGNSQGNSNPGPGLRK